MQDRYTEIGNLARELMLARSQLADARQRIAIAEDAHRRMEERMQMLEEQCQDVRDASRAVRLVKPLAWVVAAVMVPAVLGIGGWLLVAVNQVQQDISVIKAAERYQAFQPVEDSQ